MSCHRRGEGFVVFSLFNLPNLYLKAVKKKMNNEYLPAECKTLYLGGMEVRENVPESFELVSDVLAVDSGHLVSHQILNRTDFVRELNP